MVTIDSGIDFDFPASWQHFKQGKQCIFQSPKREEVVISAYSMTPVMASPDRSHYLDQLFQNGLEAARKGAAQPALRITKALAEDRNASRLPCWTVLAETEAKDGFFAQAVIRYTRGAVFLTYEAPFIEGAEKTFRDLLKMIHES